MSEENVEVKNLPPDAISYIRSSSIFDDKKYKWIAPLVEKVLADDLQPNDVRLALTGKKELSYSNSPTTIQKGLTYSIGRREIKSITEITSVSNIGLVDIKEPIELEAGLNIFYGKNGAGKSSIYLGLCRIFGKNKTVHANIGSPSKDSHCSIKYRNSNDEEKELTWETDEEKPDAQTMIFDGDIAQVLVESDQDNKFEIAHLKLEYFSKLHQMYEEAETVLDGMLKDANTKIDETENEHREELRFLFHKPPEEFEEIVAEKFTDAESKTLEDTEKQIALLGKETPDAIVKNLESAERQILSVLETFGDKDLETGEWNLRHSEEKIKQLNKRIKAFGQSKKEFEQGGRSKLAKLVPDAWVSDRVWNEFIASSIEFVETLDDDLQKKYTDKSCVYCQQELKTKESKKLIEAYKEITTEREDNLQKEEIELQGISNVIANTYLTELKSLQTRNENIAAEFHEINKGEKLTVDIDVVTAIYTNIKESVDSLSEIKLKKKDVATLTNFYATYKDLLPIFTAKIAELKKAIEDKAATLKKLEEIASPLRQKSIVDKHRKTLKAYSKSKEAKKDLKEKISQLHALKQSRSRLESEFSKIAGLKEFEKCLEKEYKSLHFTPPPYWSLKPTTKDGINKRTFRLDDKRLSDIFSEGERKLHALADFFAQCEVNKYTGLYIFDDPVNSLDEDNIEWVANRILALVKDGNQVIVFTHNLYFLNSLDKNCNKRIHRLSKQKTKKIHIENLKLDDLSSLKKNFGAIEKAMKDLEQVRVPTTEQIGFAYSLISRYLEDYVEKKLFNNIVTRYRRNLRMTSLDTLPEYNRDKIELISSIYGHTGGRAIRHSNPDEIPDPTYEDLVEDYKQLAEHLNYA